MKFGIFQELEHPRPWVEGGERRLFEEALEQVELADRLGLDAAWAVEHHFLEEYSHSSAPEVFLAAAATRTKTIRLGHGVALLPVNYNHPARAAERVATLDVISGGRVELGTGESNSRIELEGFGVDPSTKRAQWTEVVEQVANMLAMDPYPGFEGEFFSMPARNVVPKPLQKPHPPLWVACSQKETIHLAARLGLGALAFTFLKPEDARTWVDDYYETFRNECVPIGQAVNPNIALVTGFGVHPDEDEAARRFVDGIRFFQFALDHYYRSGVHKPGRTDLWGKYLADREALAATEIDPKVADLVLRRVVPWQSLGAIGTVEQVRARSGRSPRSASISFCSSSRVENRHDHICESLELFQREIMAEFREGDEERQQRKMDELAPYIERAFERKADRRPLRIPDGEIPEYETIRFRPAPGGDAVLGRIDGGS